MRNAALRLCPRCGQRECHHAERRLADALAKVGTGTTNIDVSASTRWVTSLKGGLHRAGRTAFVELKREGEGVGSGQEMALRDMTGRLTTAEGASFEQRSFIVRETSAGITLLTLSERQTNDYPYLREWRTMGVFGNMEMVAEVIGFWMIKGHLHFTYQAADGAA